jgi:putative ABC transport system substrate-binding protein
MTSARTSRRDFVVLSAGTALCWPLGASAQQAVRPGLPLIGVLNMQTEASEQTRLAAYQRGLQDGGFVVGRDVAIENRYADGQNDRLPGLAAELLRRPIAVLMANTTPPAIAAKAATTTIPIVFLTGVDPVKVGLVESLNRPGGNVTGVTFLVNLVVSKRLELLSDVVPKSASIGMLADRNNLNADGDIRDTQTAAVAMGRTLHVEKVAGPPDIEPAIAGFVQKGVAGLFIAPNANFRIWHPQILALAARHSLPTSFSTSDLVTAGALMSYGPDQLDSYRQAGELTARILKGEKPATLPVMQATKFDFVLNLRTAKALGLAISPTMLALATTVIE